MVHPDHRYRAYHSWRFILAVVCVLLVVVAGTLQIVHTHAGRADIHADCSLCAAAHVTIHMAQTPLPATVASVAAVLEGLPPSSVPNGLSTFALFTRPPPVAFVPA